MAQRALPIVITLRQGDAMSRQDGDNALRTLFAYNYEYMSKKAYWLVIFTIYSIESISSTQYYTLKSKHSYDYRN